MSAELQFLLLSMVFFVWMISAWEALLRLSWGRIRRLENENNRLAAKAEHWIETRLPYEIVFRILVFFSIALESSMIFANMEQWEVVRRWYILPHALAAGVVTLVLVVLVNVISRVLIARYDLQLLLITMPFIRVLRYSILYPIVQGVLFVRKKMDNSPRHESEEKTTTEDEIMSLIEQDDSNGDRANAMEAKERKMIRGIFDLDDTLAREIMTPRVDAVALPADASPEEAIALFCQSGYSRVPIYQGSVDEIVGVILAKDFLDRTKIEGKTLREISHKPLYVPGTKAVGELLHEFRHTRNHFAVIIDEYGGTAGIVTLEDIIEQIVGDIRDEHETVEESAPVVERDGTVVMDARTLIDDANEALDAKIPEGEDYDTIGGYVCDKLGKIPDVGEVAIVDNRFRVTVLAADQRRVLTLKIKVLDLDENDETKKGRKIA